MCHFPGMLPCWSGQCGQLVSQCYKPGDTAGHLHLRMAKKSKKGNPTPFTHGKEVQKRKFDSTKTMADKFKSWKYNSTVTYIAMQYASITSSGTWCLVKGIRISTGCSGYIHVFFTIFGWFVCYQSFYLHTLASASTCRPEDPNTYGRRPVLEPSLAPLPLRDTQSSLLH